MPYIKQDRREKWWPELEPLLSKVDNERAEVEDLAFIIFNVCLAYLKNRKLRFKEFTAIVGTLENVKLEFYLRLVSPCENIKRRENGDVI